MGFIPDQRGYRTRHQPQQGIELCITKFVLRLLILNAISFEGLPIYDRLIWCPNMGATFLKKCMLIVHEWTTFGFDLLTLVIFCGPLTRALFFQVMPSGAEALRLLGFSPSVTSLDLTSSSIRASGASVVIWRLKKQNPVVCLTCATRPSTSIVIFINF